MCSEYDFCPANWPSQYHGWLGGTGDGDGARTAVGCQGLPPPNLVGVGVEDTSFVGLGASDARRAAAGP